MVNGTDPGLPHGEERSKAARLEPSGPSATTTNRYFFGINAFSFCISLMFTFMPPGIMMSPGF